MVLVAVLFTGALGAGCGDSERLQELPLPAELDPYLPPVPGRFLTFAGTSLHDLWAPLKGSPFLAHTSDGQTWQDVRLPALEVLEARGDLGARPWTFAFTAADSGAVWAAIVMEENDHADRATSLLARVSADGQVEDHTSEIPPDRLAERIVAGWGGVFCAARLRQFADTALLQLVDGRFRSVPDVPPNEGLFPLAAAGPDDLYLTIQQPGAGVRLFRYHAGTFAPISLAGHLQHVNAIVLAPDSVWLYPEGERAGLHGDGVRFVPFDLGAIQAPSMPWKLVASGPHSVGVVTSGSMYKSDGWQLRLSYHPLEGAGIGPGRVALLDRAGPGSVDVKFSALADGTVLVVADTPSSQKVYAGNVGSGP
jgi:hypothetical protein